MQRLRILIFSLCCCGLIITTAAQSSHACGLEPLSLIKGIYANFAENSTARLSDFDLLNPFSSPQLKHLMDTEKACQEEGDRLCKYDFSVIVNGQDHILTEFDVSASATSDENLEVTASFNNFGEPSRIIYLFLKEKEQWMLMDVQSRGERSWSLVEILK